MVFFGAIGLTAVNVFLKNPSNYKKYAVAERVSLFGSPKIGAVLSNLGKNIDSSGLPKNYQRSLWIQVDFGG